MEIAFQTTKLRKLCTDSKVRDKKLGSQEAKVLGRRLDQLRAARNLEVMRELPGRCHELTADRAGQLSLDLVHPMRLIIEPADEPRPYKEDGGLDWRRVESIRVLGIEDTHG